MSHVPSSTSPALWLRMPMVAASSEKPFPSLSHCSTIPASTWASVAWPLVQSSPMLHGPRANMMFHMICHRSPSLCIAHGRLMGFRCVQRSGLFGSHLLTASAISLLALLTTDRLSDAMFRGFGTILAMMAPASSIRVDENQLPFMGLHCAIPLVQVSV